MATNWLGPFLFTKLLTPLLKSTVASSPPNFVRVAWAGSVTIDVYTPKGGILFNTNGNIHESSQCINMPNRRREIGAREKQTSTHERTIKTCSVIYKQEVISMVSF